MKISTPFVSRLSAALFAVACLVSCQSNSGGSSEWDNFEAEEDSIEAVENADTVAQKKEPTISFASADEAVEYMRNSPHADRYMQGILPQMAKDAPEYCRRLLNNTHDGFIVVDKARMKVILFDRYGVERRSYGMCCAKNFGTKHKKADSRTPEGFFTVEGTYDSTDWLFTDDNGVQSPKKGQFGPRFIRLATPVSSQIGIHGTCAPWSIGGRSSHGCIRITNENILELVKLVAPGMPVIVSPGRRDMEVNAREGYKVLAVSTVPGRAAASSPVVAEQKEEADSDSASLPAAEPTHDSGQDTQEQHTEAPAQAPEPAPAAEPENSVNGVFD